MEREEVRTTTNTTNYPSNYENDPLYKDIKLNEKLTEELKLSETLCNQFKNSLGRYYQDLQNNFNNINNILVENLEERNNVVQKKDTEIQEKDNVIQRKDTEIQEKDNVIQEKNKIIQEMGKNIQKISEEKDKKIQKIIEEKDKEIQEKDKAIQEKDKTIQEKDKAIKAIQEDDKAIQENDRTIQEKDKEIQEKDKAIQELEQENHKLKKEASEYQYAPTNYRFSDDDKYNPIKLKEDIINLQRSLENYITKCKGNVEINISEVQNLLRIYGSETTITIDQKPLIKAVLQRHVIEQIIKYGEEYFDFKNLHHHWEYGNGAETNLYNITYEITRLAEILASERDGIDETTRTLSIKLRQEVFAALANRGFNDIINGEKHDFIKTNQYNLNSEINKYRKLKDPEQNQEIEDMAGEIIRKVIALFWFLIEIQEPVSDYRWFNCNDNIQPNYMEGTWEDDEINNIAVDICYFPLIECNNGPNHQIYTPAKVLHKISETVEN
ncbi:unnamed protein product [Rhizophagus irregularis]|nr:unnamed protein product [Rhizophagus irregularis]